MSVRGRAFSLKIGGGGFFSNYQCRCSKKQSTVAINSPHNVKENWNFVFHSKNLLFCSYSRRNLTEKITLDFFFLIFFFTSVDHYLPTYIFGQPSKKYLITRKKKSPPLWYCTAQNWVRWPNFCEKKIGWDFFIFNKSRVKIGFICFR